MSIAVDSSMVQLGLSPSLCYLVDNKTQKEARSKPACCLKCSGKGGEDSSGTKRGSPGQAKKDRQLSRRGNGVVENHRGEFFGVGSLSHKALQYEDYEVS